MGRGDLAKGRKELHEICLAPLRRHVEDVAGSLTGSGRHLTSTPRRLAVEVPWLLPLHLGAQHVLVERLSSRTQVLRPMPTDGHNPRLRQTFDGSGYWTLRDAATAAAAASPSLPRAGAFSLTASTAATAPAPLLSAATPFFLLQRILVVGLTFHPWLALDAGLVFDQVCLVFDGQRLAFDPVLGLDASLGLDAHLLFDALALDCGALSLHRRLRRRHSAVAQGIPEDPVQKVVGVALGDDAARSRHGAVKLPHPALGRAGPLEPRA
mmetsp:Transcript_72803/g.158029  ORF Transcript_72803/g.158029 Transcript_72803/m.158029 type:complete len:267 (+) Transcript_72803:392-1192(+)